MAKQINNLRFLDSRSYFQFQPTHIALALSLALSTQALHSAPTLEVGGSDKSNDVKIKWQDKGGNVFSPVKADRTDLDPLASPFSELTIKFGNSYSGTTTGDKHVAVLKKSETSFILKGNTSGVQMGAPNKPGKLKIDYENNGKTFELNFSGTTASSAFIGDIETSASDNAGTAHFKATFDKSVKGNITLEHNGTDTDGLVFNNGAKLEGDLNVQGYVKTKLVFSGDNGGIKGKVHTESQASVDITLKGANSFIGSLDQTNSSGNGHNFSVVFEKSGSIGKIAHQGAGDMSVTFRESGKITDAILTTFAGKLTKIHFLKQGEVKGEIKAQSSTNEIKFGNASGYEGSANNSITGSIISEFTQGNNKVTFAGKNTTNTITGNISSENAENNLSFEGKLNTITGNVTAKQASTNRITFNNSGGTNTITGNIAITQSAGKNEITFKGKSNSLNGMITSTIPSSGSGTNKITFQTSSTEALNTIVGNIQAQNGKTEISFSGTSATNTIRGNVTSSMQKGVNQITFNTSGSSNSMEGNLTAKENGKNTLVFNGSNSNNRITGNLTADKGSNTLTFGGANSIVGSLIAKDAGTNTITFNDSNGVNTITGRIEVQGSSGSNDITFKGKVNTINGVITDSITTSGGKTNKITFQTSTTGALNTISGGIQGQLGKIEILFKNDNNNAMTNTIKGDVSSNKRSGENQITFSSSNSKNSINGKIYAKDGGKNTLFFNGSNAKNSIAKNILAENEGSNTLTLDMQSSRHMIEGSITAKGGSNTLLFTGGDLEVKGAIISQSVGSKHGLNDLKLSDQTTTTLHGNLSVGGNDSKNHITFINDANANQGATLTLKGSSNQITKLTVANTGSILVLDGKSQSTKIKQIMNADKLELRLKGRTDLVLEDASTDLNIKTIRLESALAVNAFTYASLQPSSNKQINITTQLIFEGSGSLEFRANKSMTKTLLSTDRGGTHIINLESGKPNDGANRSFRVLTIGTKNFTTANTGLANGHFIFKVFADKDATQGDSTLIGGEKTTGSGSTSYGYGYSDRFIVHNVSDNTQVTTQGLAVLIDPAQAKSLAYTGGGTSTKGNVAVATVKNNASGQVLVDLETQRIINGGEILEIGLKKEVTDDAGKAVASGGYTTYFITEARSLGVDEVVKKAVTSSLSINYELYISNFNSLNKRMGELRGSADNQGAWARIFGGSQVSNVGLGGIINYVTLQGGYDYALDFLQARNYTGIALSYLSSSGKSNQEDRGATIVGGSSSLSLDDIRSDGFEIGIYNAYVADQGWYNDTIAKLSFIYSSFILDANRSKINTWGATLSSEVGYRYVFGASSDYYLDPQLEVGVGYLNRSNFTGELKSATDTNRIFASQAQVSIFRARTGASLGKVLIESGKEKKTSLYVGGFYEYDFLHGGKGEITPISGVKSFVDSVKSNGRFVLNVGTNIELDKKARVYVDIQKSFGGQYFTHFQVNLGGRYAF